MLEKCAWAKILLDFDRLSVILQVMEIAKVEAWDCPIGGFLLDPHYFAPPISPTGVAVLEVTVFHKDYSKEGRIFKREAHGKLWKRTA